MVEVIRTHDFDVWLTKLKDRAGRLRILKRIDRLANGNPGDAKSVGNGVLELRAGRAQEIGAKAGDRIVHPFFKP